MAEELSGGQNVQNESVVLCNKKFVPNAVTHTIPAAIKTALPKRDAGCVNRQHLVFIMYSKKLGRSYEEMTTFKRMPTDVGCRD
ncbi:hypothetical protein PICMEDRAFT_172054 [Pichia membranifaciens NRRL Y-2026]|uniref:Uncharacterized protein n=1 Tax=Pichia membranifaciens NRRL Y-2026 TaxID=763406 RepID=A0A1E3NGY4_9ASCO|nr:hypothetical protein PICMEDRAFT_172054 [Pichia membranifaciens NRRL Y-2026]ODQ45410.1 hypothetical protein PICMEDRAFT_172054 [Pichia membranifaciens NRRL Y-2026]